MQLDFFRQLTTRLRAAIKPQSPAPVIASAKSDASDLEETARTLLHALGCGDLAVRVRIRWNSRMRSTAGTAHSSKSLITLNPRLRVFGDAEIDRTLRHELAHLLAHHRAGRRRISPHGREWQQACQDLGLADEKRCHDLPLPRRQMTTRHFYRCPHCAVELQRVRPLRRKSACLTCCRQHSDGRYAERFRFVKIPAPVPEPASRKKNPCPHRRPLVQSLDVFGLSSELMKKVLFLAIAALSSAVFAEPPAKIDVSNLPLQSKMIDEVVVPVPSEIFGVLDKLGKPNWVAVQHKMASVAQPIGEQPQIALQLGTVIAEGFIAVEAEDANEVKQIGKSVLNLAKALGVEKKAQVRAKAITDAAEAKDWPGVRKQLDRALEDVRASMIELNSEALSQLVSLGGWLRGTEALTAVVENQYSKEGAELLHQPILLDYFERRLANMKPKLKLNPIVIKVQKGVLEIRPFMGLPDTGDVSEKSVKEIHTISSGLVKSINSKS